MNSHLIPPETSAALIGITTQRSLQNAMHILNHLRHPTSIGIASDISPIVDDDTYLLDYFIQLYSALRSVGFRAGSRVAADSDSTRSTR